MTWLCDHGRTKGTCEECQFAKAQDAGTVSGDLYPPKRVDKARLAAKDTRVPDPLVKNRYTLVKAGDPLPDHAEAPPGKTRAPKRA